MTLLQRLAPGVSEIRKAPSMLYDWEESPSGYDLARFRESIRINGNVCTQAQFADSIGVTLERQQAYEQEKRNARMPAAIWTLARITWDALALAEWQKRRPKHD